MSLWGSRHGERVSVGIPDRDENRAGDLVGAREALDASGRFDAKGDGASFWRGSRTELLFNEGRLEQALESCDEYRDGLMQYMNPTPHPGGRCAR